ncbi:hypothetical protein CBR_g54824 [Chara braunii]|uniref:TPX2 C-terminal domain-containing protein n=1 Tax=Chara braunii TaxID=69332 RepID=A0A388JPK2_CHABU|nr:hypothetical protein CBR_g54824 [Chara braunii]|eukprot:GBG59720.1 hypothetical protein CBR_g54824 [Chara braunii]
MEVNLFEVDPTYEHISAPMYYDFCQPAESSDADEWFAANGEGGPRVRSCSRSGVHSESASRVSSDRASTQSVKSHVKEQAQVAAGTVISNANYRSNGTDAEAGSKAVKGSTVSVPETCQGQEQQVSAASVDHASAVGGVASHPGSAKGTPLQTCLANKAISSPTSSKTKSPVNPIASEKKIAGSANQRTTESKGAAGEANGGKESEVPLARVLFRSEEADQNAPPVGGTNQGMASSKGRAHKDGADGGKVHGTMGVGTEGCSPAGHGRSRHQTNQQSRPASAVQRVLVDSSSLLWRGQHRSVGGPTTALSRMKQSESGIVGEEDAAITATNLRKCKSNPVFPSRVLVSHDPAVVRKGGTSCVGPARAQRPGASGIEGAQKGCATSTTPATQVGGLGGLRSGDAAHLVGKNAARVENLPVRSSVETAAERRGTGSSSGRTRGACRGRIVIGKKAGSLTRLSSRLAGAAGSRSLDGRGPAVTSKDSLAADNRIQSGPAVGKLAVDGSAPARLGSHVVATVAGNADSGLSSSSFCAGNSSGGKPATRAAAAVVRGGGRIGEGSKHLMRSCGAEPTPSTPVMAKVCCSPRCASKDPNYNQRVLVAGHRLRKSSSKKRRKSSRSRASNGSSGIGKVSQALEDAAVEGGVAHEGERSAGHNEKSSREASTVDGSEASAPCGMNKLTNPVARHGDASRPWKVKGGKKKGETGSSAEPLLDAREAVSLNVCCSHEKQHQEQSSASKCNHFSAPANIPVFAMTSAAKLSPFSGLQYTGPTTSDGPVLGDGNGCDIELGDESSFEKEIEKMENANLEELCIPAASGLSSTFSQNISESSSVGAIAGGSPGVGVTSGSNGDRAIQGAGPISLGKSCFISRSCVLDGNEAMWMAQTECKTTALPAHDDGEKSGVLQGEERGVECVVTPLPSSKKANGMSGSGGMVRTSGKGRVKSRSASLCLTRQAAIAAAAMLGEAESLLSDKRSSKEGRPVRHSYGGRTMVKERWAGGSDEDSRIRDRVLHSRDTTVTVGRASAEVSSEGVVEGLLQHILYQNVVLSGRRTLCMEDNRESVGDVKEVVQDDICKGGCDASECRGIECIRLDSTPAQTKQEESRNSTAGKNLFDIEGVSNSPEAGSNGNDQDTQNCFGVGTSGTYYGDEKAVKRGRRELSRSRSKLLQYRKGDSPRCLAVRNPSREKANKMSIAREMNKLALESRRLRLRKMWSSDRMLHQSGEETVRSSSNAAFTCEGAAQRRSTSQWKFNDNLCCSTQSVSTALPGKEQDDVPSKETVDSARSTAATKDFILDAMSDRRQQMRKSLTRNDICLQGIKVFRRLSRAKTRLPLCKQAKLTTTPRKIVLYSELRAIQRMIFDQKVAEKQRMLEMERREQERLRKLAEEEEIKLLRKQMVPRARLMPYFDRPFRPSKNGLHMHNSPASVSPFPWRSKRR